MSDTTLGAYDDLDGGEIGADLFGLDEFGNVAGSRELWGAILGSAVGTGTAIAVRAFTDPKADGQSGFDFFKHSELIGLAAGAATAGALMASPTTRAAGWTCLATSAVNNGLRVLEQMFSKKNPLAGVVVDRLNGFGIVQPEMSGWGAATIEQVAGPQLGAEAPPVDILAAGALPDSAAHVGVMGGPTLSGLGAHFGTTMFDGG